jgi:hypothetical protein
LLTDSPNVKNVGKPPSFVGEVVVDPIKPLPPDPIKPPPPSFVGEVVVDPIKPLPPPDFPNAENLKEQSAKEEKALERIERLRQRQAELERLRQRQAELGEQLSKLKSTWIAQRVIPKIPPWMLKSPIPPWLPEPPLAIPPWAWALPKPIMPMRAERRRKVPA